MLCSLSLAIQFQFNSILGSVLVYRFTSWAATKHQTKHNSYPMTLKQRKNNAYSPVNRYTRTEPNFDTLTNINFTEVSKSRIHEFIIYAMRQRARADTLTIRYRKKQLISVFHASVLLLIACVAWRFKLFFKLFFEREAPRDFWVCYRGFPA